MLYNIYFSAKGTTKKCADFVVQKISKEIKTFNWLSIEERVSVDMLTQDVLLFSMPVYGGYIPQICLEPIQKLHGQNTPAIIQAVYGNRHFDNALIQMQDLLEKQGFKVIAAGTFLAEHSIFPTVAADRPNIEDYVAMEKFALQCKDILANNDLIANGKLTVPGDKNFDPLAFKGVPFHPHGDESCIGCMQCVNVCPAQAITMDNPKLTNNELCISCGACISICPVNARNYYEPIYQQAKAGFEIKCKEVRQAQVFYLKAQ